MDIFNEMGQFDKTVALTYAGHNTHIKDMGMSLIEHVNDVITHGLKFSQLSDDAGDVDILELVQELEDNGVHITITGWPEIEQD